MNINRRFFVAGLGAAIVAASLPIASLSESFLPTPVFVLPKNPNGWFLTAQHLMDCMKAIGEQLVPYEKIALSDGDKRTIAEAIDATLWEIKPAGLRILIEAPMQALISGEFQLIESALGTVTIKGS
jgi:hypothetical protein